VFSTPTALHDFREAMRKSIAAGAGSFFDRVLPGDVRVEEHAGADEESIAVIGRVTPANEEAVGSIRDRLSRSTLKLRQTVVLEAKKLNLSAVTVADAKVVGKDHGGDVQSYASMISGAVHDMEASRPSADEHAGPEHVLADDSSEKVVSCSMLIDNVDFDRLMANADLCSRLRKTVKNTIASMAGGSVGPDDVDMSLSAGSVQVHCAIEGLSGASARSAASNLESAKPYLPELMLMRVSGLLGIGDVTTGEMAIRGLSVLLEDPDYGKGVEGEGTKIDGGVAGLLIGALSGVILLFGLLYWRDSSIRKLAWTTVSPTVPVVASLLVFDCFGRLADELLRPAPFPAVYLLVCYLMVLVLLAAVHAATGIVSGAVDEQSTRMLRMRCYLSLLTYMTAFAAINAGSACWQYRAFSANPVTALLAIVPSQTFLWAFFLLFRLAHRRQLQEKGQEAPWEAECTRAESQITSLSGSFLVVQVLRFLISGVLPDKAGIEHPEKPHSSLCVLLLYAAGFAAAAASVLVRHDCVPGRIRAPSGCVAGNELRRMLQSACSMAFAWCLLGATGWMALRIEALRRMGVAPGTVSWQVFLAAVVSLLACALLPALKVVEAKLPRDGAPVDSLAVALGLMLGLSWRRLFGAAAARACGSCWRPGLTEAALSLALGLLLVPAWTQCARRHGVRSAGGKDTAGDGTALAVEIDVEGDRPHDAAMPLVGVRA